MDCIYVSLKIAARVEGEGLTLVSRLGVFIRLPLVWTVRVQSHLLIHSEFLSVCLLYKR